MKHSQNLEEQNFDDLIVGFKGETLRENVYRKVFVD